MLRSTPAVPLDFFFQRGRGTGAGSASDLQIRVLLRFGGLLDLGLLERALHAIVDAEPMLRARLVETSPLVGRWEVRDDEGAVPPCELDEVTEADAESAVASFLSGTAVRDEGPYVRLRVVRAGRRDALCLRIDHRLCDGGAAKILTARLCDAYRRLSAGAHLQPPRRELLPRSVSGLTGRALPPPPPPPPPG